MRAIHLKRISRNGLAFILVLQMLLSIMPFGALASELPGENAADSEIILPAEETGLAEELAAQETVVDTDLNDPLKDEEKTGQLPETESTAPSEELPGVQETVNPEAQTDDPQAALPDEQGESEQAEEGVSEELSDPFISTELPVPVVFACTPETAKVCVFYLPTEKGEGTAEILNPEDGVWSLMPGDYLYSVEAEGYNPLHGVPLTVAMPENGGILIVNVTLTAAEPDGDAVEKDNDDSEETKTEDRDEETDDADQEAVYAASDTVSTAAAGRYRIMVKPERATQADFYSLSVCIQAGSADGQAILFEQDLNIDMSSEQTKWAEVEVLPTLSAAPATITFTSMYAVAPDEQGNYPHERLEYTAVFQEGLNQQAVAESYNYPGQSVCFCSYSIRYLGEQGRLAYVDAKGVTQYREEGQWQNFNGATEGSGWYAVRENLPPTPALTIEGDCNLVLCEGVQLNVTEGIVIAGGSTLTVWEQKPNSGAITASGSTVETASSAGIQVLGSLIINSGTVTATGGRYCAGIGSSGSSSGRSIDSGSITINGGTVTATGGEYAAGIGGGRFSNSGPITITGGTVTAEGKRGGAGIGGGQQGNSGEIVISGGTVNAKGATGAGIGSGSGLPGGDFLGTYGSSGPITITGGNITAESTGGAGIGGGYAAPNRGEIRISGATVRATSQNSQASSQTSGDTYSAGIGAGCRCAQEGAIVIFGGATVLAVSEGCGAGIGGGAGGTNNTGLSGGTIWISGKETDVCGISRDGAGIGSGGTLIGGGSSSGNFNGGTITIDEGFVYGRSYNSGAGIGGGNGGHSGKITINGGYVIGIGGERNYNWAKENNISDPFAGPGKHPINGWLDKDAYTMISNAILEASLSGEYAGAGIGGGSGGTCNSGDNYVRINGGYVEAKSGQAGCSAIGWGKDSPHGTQDISFYSSAFVSIGTVAGTNGENVTVTGSASRNRTTDELTTNGYVFIEPGFTVSYDMQGHGTAPESITVPYGGSVAEPADPEATEWIFTGWFADAACTQKFDFSWLIGEDTTIYAEWRDISPFPKVFSVKINWGESESIPEYVDVLLEQKIGEGDWVVIVDDMNKVQARLDESNQWRVIFGIQDPQGEYRIRELDSNVREVCNGDEEGASSSTEPLRNEAVFSIDEDGKTRQYHYTVSYEIDPYGNTKITNLRDGIIYTAETAWTLNEGSYAWNDIIAGVDAVLQHRERDEAGNESWVTVDTASMLSAERWRASFRAVPLDSDENYRVREKIHNRKYESSGFVFDPDEPEGQEIILYDRDDAEANGKLPSMTYCWHFRDGTPGSEHYEDRMGYFDVSYSRDDNGNFIVTNREQDPNAPKFVLQSLVLSGQIGVNFYMDLSALTEEQRAASYMTFSITGKGNTTERDSYDPAHKNQTDFYYGFTCYINSVQMADTITATYHYSGGSGEEKTVSKTYSVKEYIEKYTASSGTDQSEKVLNLIHAIADYGHYAQPYLSDTNGWAIGTDYAEMGIHYTEGYADTDAIIQALNGKEIYRTLNADIAQVTFSLNLDSSTMIYLYVKPAEGYTGAITATINGSAAEAVQRSDGRYRVTIPSISAHQLGEMYDVVLTTENGTSGVKVSAMSYVLLGLKEPMNDAEKNALAALYQYYTAAAAYLA